MSKPGLDCGHAAVLVALMISGSVGAEPNKAEYELSERCGKSTLEWYEHQFGPQGPRFRPPPVYSSYQNHYNRHQNRCMVVLTEDSDSSESLTLFDLHEKGEIGVFFKWRQVAQPDKCFVAEKHCASKDEWRAIARPFMEE